MITAPNLRCDHCYEMRADYVPACEYGQCEIEDLASDPVLNQTIAKFLRAKALAEMSGDLIPYRTMCRELGLYGDPETHFRLEALYKKWQDNHHQPSLSDLAHPKQTKTSQ